MELCSTSISNLPVLVTRDYRTYLYLNINILILYLNQPNKEKLESQLSITEATWESTSMLLRPLRIGSLSEFQFIDA